MSIQRCRRPDSSGSSGNSGGGSGSGSGDVSAITDQRPRNSEDGFAARARLTLNLERDGSCKCTKWRKAHDKETRLHFAPESPLDTSNL